MKNIVIIFIVEKFGNWIKKKLANNNTCVDDWSKFDYEEDNKCYNNLTAEEQN